MLNMEIRVYHFDRKKIVRKISIAYSGGIILKTGHFCSQKLPTERFQNWMKIYETFGFELLLEQTALKVYLFVPFLFQIRVLPQA